MHNKKHATNKTNLKTNTIPAPKKLNSDLRVKDKEACQEEEEEEEEEAT